MGRMKELAMDYDEAFDLIGSLARLIHDDSRIEATQKSKYIDELEDISNSLVECRSVSNVAAPSIIFGTLREVVDIAMKHQSVLEVRHLSPRLNICSTQLRVQLMSKQSVLNSKEFYEGEIADLKQNILSLEREIANLENRNNHNQSQLENKELLLSQQNSKLLGLEHDLEELKRREDARKDWGEKIKEAFSTLQTGLKPIKAEKFRLNVLYYVYCGLSALLIALLVAVEIIISHKLRVFDGIPTFQLYVSLVAPIPVALAVLFVFISQINRTQRQLVAVAKYIHDIEYTEEIMLAINRLSVDIDDSMKRINIAMDRLLDRHLACDLNYLEEAALQKQEDRDKDTIPVGQVTDIIKGIIEQRN